MSASVAAGRRALVNTVLRIAGELSGKFATLVLFVFIARQLDQHAVGTFVFAFAFVQVAVILVDLGFDRLVVRRVALDASSMRTLFPDVMALKLALAVPVAGAIAVVGALVAEDRTTQLAIYALTGGLVLDSLTRTVHSIFNARERGGMLSVSIVAQRVTGAAIGIGALFLGYGVVAVSVAYGIGAFIGLFVAVVLLVRNIGRPALRVDPRNWPDLMRESVPFAVYQSLSFLLTKIDTLILGAVTTQAAVGVYGPASRLYEASFFLTYSLAASFAAMYTYLDRDTDPTIGSMFERSIKVALTALMPLSVGFVVIAEPLCVTLFGEQYRSSALPLQLLAPSVALMGVVTLSTALISLRSGARAIGALTGGILAVNIILNVLLARPLGAEGAAAAMSISLGLFAAFALRRAVNLVGGVHLGRMLAAPLAAGAAMGLAAEPMPSAPLAIAVGSVAFALTYLAVERLVAPADLQFLAQLLLRRGQDPAPADVGVAPVATEPSGAQVPTVVETPPPTNGAAQPKLRVDVVQSFAERGGSEAWLLRLLEAGDELDSSVVLLKDGPLREHFERAVARVDVRKVGPSPAAFPLPALWLLRRWRRDRPDVVLANGVKAQLIAAPAARLLRLPLVWAKHDHSYDRLLARPLGRAARRVIAAADEVAESTGRDDVVIVPPPRPVPGPASREEARAHLTSLGIPLDDAPTLVMPGRLVPFKGVDDAVAALALPAARDWKLVVAGLDDHAAPGETERLRALAAELGVIDRVHFAGFVDGIARWLAAFDALALLTKPALRAPAQEGYGMTATEAMLAGIPVIAVDRGAVGQRLGAAGIAVEPGDPEGVAAALERFSDPAVRAAAAEAGRVIVADHPDVRECADRLVATLRDADRSRSSRRRPSGDAAGHAARA